MTPAIRLARRGGRLIRCAAVAMALTLGTSAFADTDKTNASVNQQQAQRRGRKACYTMTTVSRIPLDCKQLAAIPTTASPMSIFGHKPRAEKD